MKNSPAGASEEELLKEEEERPGMTRRGLGHALAAAKSADP